MGLTRRAASALTEYENPDSFTSKLRRRRFGPLLKLAENAHARTGSVRVLDVGGTRAYWNIMSTHDFQRLNMHVTLVNLPGMSPEVDEPGFASVNGDACDLRAQYAANAFDIVHSNSVIEHVGDWTRMTMFAAEVRRLAPAYFVQTPNFWFPIEPHFMSPLFHWLPVPVRAALIRRFSLGHRKRQPDVGSSMLEVESVHLLDRRMMSFLFPDASLVTERLLGLPKSLIAIRQASGAGKLAP